MASEWAMEKAASVAARSRVEIVAAALDAARQEGEQRERWECWRLAQLNIVSSSPGSWNDAVDVIAGRIAARGAMRDGTD